MNTALPLVSIALTTYNGAQYLAQQMDSLLAQDYPHFEIVVSDDGSSDGTLALLQRYAAQHARVRVLPAQTNLGFNGNFARCFAACRGELISPCDQDDVWHLDKTSRLFEQLADATAIYCNSRFVNGDGVPLNRRMSDDVRMVQGSDPRAFLFGNSVSGHAMLFRRTLLQAAGTTPPGLYFDWWLAFVASNVGRLVYLDEVLVDYRRHGQAITCAPQRQDAAQRRLTTLRLYAQRFTAMAAYAGPQQQFIQQLQRHWLDWYHALFSWAMFRFVWRHADALFQASPARRSSWQRASKYLLGHRLKRLLWPGAYLPLDVAAAPAQTERGFL